MVTHLLFHWRVLPGKRYRSHAGCDPASLREFDVGAGKKPLRTQRSTDLFSAIFASFVRQKDRFARETGTAKSPDSVPVQFKGAPFRRLQGCYKTPTRRSKKFQDFNDFAVSLPLQALNIRARKFGNRCST